MKRRCTYITLRAAVALCLYPRLSLSQAVVAAPRLGLGSETLRSEEPQRAPPISRRATIGIALEGGGALGLAHIGVLKWMTEHRIPVDSIAGTSMGALVGSIFASGHSSAEAEELVARGLFDDMFSLKPALKHLSFRRREDRYDLPQAMSLGLKGGSVTPGSALIDDDRLNSFLSHELAAYNRETLSFDELPIPFRCVATDLVTLRPFLFASGPLTLAVRASISIPGVFQPILRDHQILVDGAIVNNLPTEVVRHDLHADIVVAVHLSDGAFNASDATSLVSVFARAFQAGTNRNEEISRGRADIVILPQVETFSSSDYKEGPALIKAGYDAAEAQRAALLPLALSEPEWVIYQQGMRARRRSAPASVRAVRVDGPDPAVSAEIGRLTATLNNLPFDSGKAASLVSDIRGTGGIDAYYATYSTPARPGDPTTRDPSMDDAIVIHWTPEHDGPPYLLLSEDVDALSSNVTRTEFNLRLVDENLGGYGSELRTDAHLGYLTHLHTEYYRRLGQSSLFLQPHLDFFRQPVYLWQDQHRISERLLQRAGGGLDLGATLNKDLQLSLQYRASTVLWQLRDGADYSPTQHLSAVTQSVGAHITYSNRTAELASPAGTRLELTAGRLLATAEVERAPFLLFNARKTLTLAQRHLFSFSVEANSYLRHDVPDPLRPTLGGPMRLNASSTDEYRGTDAVLTQATYLRRVATLPTGLGQGVFLVSGYEAGEIWSPERHVVLRQDGFTGILLNTPLGAISLGGAIGDAGHRKFFATFGKLF